MDGLPAALLQPVAVTRRMAGRHRRDLPAALLQPVAATRRMAGRHRVEVWR